MLKGFIVGLIVGFIGGAVIGTMSLIVIALIAARRRDEPWI